MRFQLAILVSVLAQFALGFDLATYKKQYQAAVGDPFQNADTVFATNIIEYLAVTPVPTTPDAASQMTRNLISQAQSFTDSLTTAAASSDALKSQLEKESQLSNIEQQIAANEKQLQLANAQIQQTNVQVTDMQNQVNAASKSVQDANDNLIKQQQACGAGWKGIACKISQNDNINRAIQNLANCQQRLTSVQTQLTQLQAHLAQLTEQRKNLQQAKTGLEAKKMQQIQINQARDNLDNVSTNLREIIAHVSLLGQNQVLVDVVKNLIDMETVVTPMNAIADQVIGYSASAYNVNYLNILKQKVQTNSPLVQQKLSQFVSIQMTA